MTYTLPGSPGDQLWADVGKSNVLGREPPDAPKFLIHAGPPPLGEHPKLWFTYRGFSPTIPLD